LRAKLQDAYNAAATNDTFQIKDAILNEDINVNADKTVTLIGGYGCDFTTNTGETKINGILSITSGTLIINNGELVIGNSP
jgi:ABC-type proline/glycine betaine transport system ATPase subunit